MPALAARLWARAASLACPPGTLARAWAGGQLRDATRVAAVTGAQLDDDDLLTSWAPAIVHVHPPVPSPLASAELEHLAAELEHLAPVARDSWTEGYATGLHRAAAHVREWCP